MHRFSTTDERGGLIPRQMAPIVNNRADHVICHVRTVDYGQMFLDQRAKIYILADCLGQHILGQRLFERHVKLKLTYNIMIQISSSSSFIDTQ